MNKEFCINCGHKNLFEVSKPKFCAGCGTAFNVLSSRASVNVQAQESEDQEENYQPRSFDINKLKKSVVFESKASVRTLDELWKDPAPRESNSFRAHSSDPSGREIIKKTMAECSPVKQVKEIGDE